MENICRGWGIYKLEVYRQINTILEPPLHPARGVLGTSPVVSMRKQHYQATLTHPFFLRTCHKSIYDKLSRVVKISELGLPKYKISRVLHSISNYFKSWIYSQMPSQMPLREDCYKLVIYPDSWPKRIHLLDTIYPQSFDQSSPNVFVRRFLFLHPPHSFLQKSPPQEGKIQLLPLQLPNQIHYFGPIKFCPLWSIFIF